MILMITNSIVPYCYDIFHVMCLPDKLAHRFRYRQKWISPSYPVSKMRSKRAIIVLRDFNTGDFIPLRYVSFENVLQFGDICYLDFQVGDLFDSEQIPAASAQIAQHLKANGIDNLPGQQLSSLLFDMKDGDCSALLTTNIKEKEANWAQLQNRLGQLKCFANVSFLRVFSVVDSTGEKISATKDATGKFSLCLSPGKLYYLNVFQHIPWDIESSESIDKPFNVELKTETDEFILLRRIQRVVGKYDLLRFSFKIPASCDERQSFLELESKLSGTESKHRIPTLFLPIRVELSGLARTYKRIRKPASVIAVIALLLSAPLSKVLPFDAEVIRTIALFILILAVGQVSQIVPTMAKESKIVQSP